MSKIEIELAFVEAWNRTDPTHPNWIMKCAEPHSKKNADGKYETIARTFRTIRVSKASGIDLSQFAKGDRVQVWGNELTVTRVHAGKTYYDLVVWADRVERVGESGHRPATTSEVGEDCEQPTGYTELSDTETPF
jgi:hypothetical protein